MNTFQKILTLFIGIGAVVGAVISEWLGGFSRGFATTNGFNTEFVVGVNGCFCRFVATILVVVASEFDNVDTRSRNGVNKIWVGANGTSTA